MKSKNSMWERYEAYMLNSGVTQKRISKLSNMFKVISRGIDKPLEKATREDIEAFVTALHKDRFLTEKGKAYSGSSKSDIKKFLKQFYKWLLGDGEVYPKQVSWLRTNNSKDEKPQEKPTLSYEEVVKLANGFNKMEYRIMTLILFDSGFRIAELLSMRKKDITWEDFDRGTKCFWVNCNESKTITRKIPIPLFTEDIQNFVNSSYYKALKDDDKIWQMSYWAINKAMVYASKKVLKRDDITPHALRHSSATYYSKIYDGNTNLIGERYGWSFNSNELKTYIRRSGAYQKAGAKKVYENELIKVQQELSELKKRMDDMQKEMMILKAKDVIKRKGDAK